MFLLQLETPVPVVDLEIVHQNIRRLQRYCDAHELKLRPHIKTHKLPLFAHEQCKAGAIGITVQKIGEAEVMTQTGMTDVLLTYNVVGQAKAERLAHLTHFARISVAIDNDKALESVAWAGRDQYGIDDNSYNGQNQRQNPISKEYLLWFHGVVKSDSPQGGVYSSDGGTY